MSTGGRTAFVAFEPAPHVRRVAAVTAALDGGIGEGEMHALRRTWHHRYKPRTAAWHTEHESVLCQRA